MKQDQASDTSKDDKLKNYKLFYEMAEINGNAIPKPNKKKPGPKPKRPSLPQNVLDNLD